MRAIESYKGHTIHKDGCCGDVSFAISRPNGIIFERGLDSIDDAKTIVDRIVDSAKSNNSQADNP